MDHDELYDRICSKRFDSLHEDMNERFDKTEQLMKDLVTPITAWMHGNGSPGAKIRIDRMEQQWKVAIWCIALLITTMAGIVGWIVKTALTS